tara:strand:- start:263 stop:505 length:243 start_codon:yes stop_codon:yes gene_type:complete
LTNLKVAGEIEFQSSQVEEKPLVKKQMSDLLRYVSTDVSPKNASLIGKVWLLLMVLRYGALSPLSSIYALVICFETWEWQ